MEYMKGSTTNSMTIQNVSNKNSVPTNSLQICLYAYTLCLNQSFKFRWREYHCRFRGITYIRFRCTSCSFFLPIHIGIFCMPLGKHFYYGNGSMQSFIGTSRGVLCFNTVQCSNNLLLRQIQPYRSISNIQSSIFRRKSDMNF